MEADGRLIKHRLCPEAEENERLPSAGNIQPLPGKWDLSACSRCSSFAFITEQTSSGLECPP